MNMFGNVYVLTSHCMQRMSNAIKPLAECAKMREGVMENKLIGKRNLLYMVDCRIMNDNNVTTTVGRKLIVNSIIKPCIG